MNFSLKRKCCFKRWWIIFTSLYKWIAGILWRPLDKKYIFPGGVIPSLREMIHICSDYKYHTIDVESLRLHYVKTLLYWQKLL